MNAELHHRWNEERDPSRGSFGNPSKPGPPILKEDVAKNTVLLKQNKPR
jgi:hypothetical protein